MSNAHHWVLDVQTKQSKGSLDTKFDNMSPREISYWLALVFAQNPVIQQALLEVKTALSNLSLCRPKNTYFHRPYFFTGIARVPNHQEPEMQVVVCCRSLALREG